MVWMLKRKKHEYYRNSRYGGRWELKCFWMENWLKSWWLPQHWPNSRGFPSLTYNEVLTSNSRSMCDHWKLLHDSEIQEEGALIILQTVILLKTQIFIVHSPAPHVCRCAKPYAQVLYHLSNFKIAYDCTTINILPWIIYLYIIISLVAL